MKITIQNKKAEDAFVNGINAVANIVSSTLGPFGRNVALTKGWGAPVITNDGVSIAREIECEDVFENEACESIKGVAKKTDEEAKDSTTTSITLAQAIYLEGLKHRENPIEIMKSLNDECDKLVTELKKVSKPVNSKNDIKNVATISAESEETGSIIADTYEAIGNDGIISVEESTIPGIEVEMVEGYEMKKGLAHFQMGGQTGKVTFDNAYCLVMAGNLQLASEILPFLQKIESKTKELVIFCDNVDGGVINFFLMNKVAGNFNGVIVRCQSQKDEILEDIATVTGATLVRRDTGVPLESLELKVLGRARKITIGMDKTTIIDGKGNIKNLVATLKQNLLNEKNDNQFDLIENRIARLTGGMAILRVGAKTEERMRYLKDKVDDAVGTAKSAIEEGIVEGGGMTLYRLSESLTGGTVGSRILKKALKQPLRKIIENAGKDYDDVLGEIRKQELKGKRVGYNAKDDTYVDMIKTGIMDSTKGQRCALENAVSWASSALTMVAIVANKKEETK